MVSPWKLDLIRPSDAITIAVNQAWADALADLEKWIGTDLIDAMIYGGLGIQGISQTTFYRFISSPEGLSELGIESSEPPRLLDAYRDSFKVSRNNKIIMLKFGDVARLKLGTPHPASGTGFLQIDSWMEWILDGVNVGSGYVPRTKLPRNAQKRIRINSAPGGLMLPRGVFGSTGSWRFPTSLNDYDMDWFKTNIAAIESAITDAITLFLTRKLT